MSVRQTQKRLEAATKKKWDIFSKYQKLEAALLDVLIAKGCDHRKTEEYKWETDNGYGKQSIVTGIRCKYCHAEKSWGDHQSYWVRNGEMLVSKKT